MKDIENWTHRNYAPPIPIPDSPRSSEVSRENAQNGIVERARLRIIPTLAEGNFENKYIEMFRRYQFGSKESTPPFSATTPEQRALIRFSLFPSWKFRREDTTILRYTNGYSLDPN